MKSYMFLIWLIGIFCCGCLPQKPIVIVPTPAPGKGQITGQVDLDDNWSASQTLKIFAAHYKEINNEGGIYLLEPNLDPQVKLDKNGYFLLNDLNPGKYVLMVGAEAEDAILVVDSESKARVIEVKADKVIHLNKLTLANH
jgi:hypothetical protein